MPNPNWELIREEWETTNKTYKELEEQFNVKSSTIRSRKNREKWQRNATSNATQQKKSVATKKRATVAKNKKRTTSNTQKNRSGNPNPKNQFTERNSAALKHGLFSRYIPRETLELMGMLDDKSPADLIWDQIQIQYAAIIRAQQIMFVTDKNETIKELKKSKYEVIPSDNDDGYEQVTTEEEYEFQFAWDRHATFLNAQSRAMSELRSLIKQFNELAHDNDERKLKLQLMQANIDKANAEVEKIKKDQEGEAPPQIMIIDEWSSDDE